MKNNFHKVIASLLLLASASMISTIAVAEEAELTEDQAQSIDGEGFSTAWNGAKKVYNYVNKWASKNPVGYDAIKYGAGAAVGGAAYSASNNGGNPSTGAGSLNR